jgi:hypothetical protein
VGGGNCSLCGGGKYQTGEGMADEFYCLLCSAGKYQSFLVLF